MKQRESEGDRDRRRAYHDKSRSPANKEPSSLRLSHRAPLTSHLLVLLRRIWGGVEEEDEEDECNS